MNNCDMLFLAVVSLDLKLLKNESGRFCTEIVYRQNCRGLQGPVFERIVLQSMVELSVIIYSINI